MWRWPRDGSCCELPFAVRTRRDFDIAVRDPTKAAHQWLMRRLRIRNYKLALEILDIPAQREALRTCTTYTLAGFAPLTPFC